MKKRSGHGRLPPPEEAVFAAKKSGPIPHAFVLEALASSGAVTRPLFGCLAIYVEEQIVLVLREKAPLDPDNGVWLATTKEHHAALRPEFPSMRSIEVLGQGTTGWQVLPASAPDFEEAALHACELVLAGDPRIGKIPGQRRRRS